MPSPDSTNGHDEIAMQTEFARFGSPAQRMAFLKEQGIEHHFLVSGKELAAIQGGTDKLHHEIRKWRTLSQATHGVSDPERALEVTQQQARHRKGIADDRLRYRNALMEILKRSRKMMANGDVAELGNLARDAINNE